MGKRKTPIEGRTKEERAVLRRRLGTLHELSVQPATRKRYDLALDRFLKVVKPTRKHGTPKAATSVG